MTTRLVGTCPVCERQQKVTPGGAMVHHGYVRPGTGSIHGDCFGVGYPAYQLSTKGCEAYRKFLAEWRAGQEARLRRLYDRPEEVTYQPSPYSTAKTYRRDADTPEERRRYDSTLVQLIQQTEYTIKDLDRSDRRMVRLIEQWAPAPLVEIDEEGLTPAKREERATRKTERDTKRSEKDQKKRELSVKRNERIARKATTLLFFFDEFERLAQLPPSAARLAYARDLLFEAAKKKHGISYPRDMWMGPDDGVGNRIPGPWGRDADKHAERTLVALGVAKLEKHQHGDYVTLLPVYSSQGNKISVPEPGPTDEVLAWVASRRPPA